MRHEIIKRKNEGAKYEVIIKGAITEANVVKWTLIMTSLKKSEYLIPTMLCANQRRMYINM